MEATHYSHTSSRSAARASIAVVLTGIAAVAWLLRPLLFDHPLVLGLVGGLGVVALVALATVRDIVVRVTAQRLVLRGVHDRAELDLAAIRRVEVRTRGGEVSANWGDTLVIGLIDGEILEIDGSSIGGAQAVAEALHQAIAARRRQGEEPTDRTRR